MVAYGNMELSSSQKAGLVFGGAFLVGDKTTIKFGKDLLWASVVTL